MPCKGKIFSEAKNNLPRILPIAAGNEFVFKLDVVAIFPARASADFDGLAESTVFNTVIDVGFAKTSIGHDEFQVNECIVTQFHIYSLSGQQKATTTQIKKASHVRNSPGEVSSIVSMRVVCAGV